MRVYLDDLRNPLEGYTLVRNVEDCITLLEKNNVDILSLDHDLGENEKDGYQVVLWLENKIYEEPQYVPPFVVTHSQNPVGRERIKAGAFKINQARAERKP